jgi:hypothetical protein
MSSAAQRKSSPRFPIHQLVLRTMMAMTARYSDMQATILKLRRVHLLRSETLVGDTPKKFSDNHVQCSWKSRLSSLHFFPLNNFG